jgi:8-amino-7-oxononanoate synthase
MSDPLGWLDDRAEQRRHEGLRRAVRPREAGAALVDFASNDYLGLARHPDVVAGAVDAARAWGAGSTGSRLVTGSTRLHAELEQRLARFTGSEAALVFSSGYLANLGAIAALAAEGDLVVSDELNHASIVDACRLSRARVAIAPHRDAAAVEALLADRDEERAVVITDAVFSVDGDAAPLRDLHEACLRQGAVLVIDEAHALGVVGAGGRGLAADSGLAGAPDVVLTVTLSKSLGSQGGAVLGSERVVAHLIDTARTFIFDTGLAPAAAGAALAAIGVIESQPQRAAAARQRAIEIAQTAQANGLRAPNPAAAVTAVHIGAPQSAVEAGEIFAQHGAQVGVFRPPSVSDGISRLRLTARANLGDDEMALAAEALANVARSVAHL